MLDGFQNVPTDHVPPSKCVLISTLVQAAKDKGLSDTKLLVKNLAFEATAKDVRGLLEAFGHVKTCRLPQKFDGSKRGFAFVEFGTKGEAKKAVESVQGTHLCDSSSTCRCHAKANHLSRFHRSTPSAPLYGVSQD